MQLFEILRKDTAHHIGKAIDDASMSRKKYDFLYEQERKRIKCTFTHQEYKRIKKEADKAGLKQATYLKRVYHAYHENRPILPSHLEDNLAISLKLLRNIANNVNQIAQKTNTLQKVALGDLLTVKQNVHQLEKIIRNAFLM